MSDPMAIEKVPREEPRKPWLRRLVFFLRAMALVSMAKGLYHWSLVLGIGDGDGSNIEIRLDAVAGRDGVLRRD